VAQRVPFAKRHASGIRCSNRPAADSSRGKIALARFAPKNLVHFLTEKCKGSRLSTKKYSKSDFVRFWVLFGRKSTSFALLVKKYPSEIAKKRDFRHFAGTYRANLRFATFGRRSATTDYCTEILSEHGEINHQARPYRAARARDSALSRAVLHGR